jgi:hypothetical protein
MTRYGGEPALSFAIPCRLTGKLAGKISASFHDPANPYLGSELLNSQV